MNAEPVAEAVQDAAPIVNYSPSEAAIALLREEYADLLADPGAIVQTAEGYDRIRRGISHIVGMRTGIEKKRVELKAEALAYGRKVDDSAKHLKGLLLEIETPLRAAKEAEDDKKAAAERARVEAEQARVAAAQKAARDADEARLKAIRDAEEAKLAAERERLAAERAAMEAERKAAEEQQRAERAKIEAEQKAERDRVAAEQAAMRAERDRLHADRLAADLARQAERDKLDAEKRAVQAEKDRLDRIEFERVTREKVEADAKVRAEQAAKAKAEADERARIEAERIARERAEAEAAEAKRQEELRPDIEKVRGFGDALKALSLPAVKNAKATEFLAAVRKELVAIAGRCHAFGQKSRGEAAKQEGAANG